MALGGGDGGQIAERREAQAVEAGADAHRVARPGLGPIEAGHRQLDPRLGQAAGRDVLHEPGTRVGRDPMRPGMRHLGARHRRELEIPGEFRFLAGEIEAAGRTQFGGAEADLAEGHVEEGGGGIEGAGQAAALDRHRRPGDVARLQRALVDGEGEAPTETASCSSAKTRSFGFQAARAVSSSSRI